MKTLGLFLMLAADEPKVVLHGVTAEPFRQTLSADKEPVLDLLAKYRVSSALNEALATKVELDDAMKRHEAAVKKYEAIMAEELAKVKACEGGGLDRQQNIVCPPKKEEKK